MTTVSITEATQTLPELLRAVEDGPVAIRDAGHDVAFLIKPSDWSERAKKLARLEQSRSKVVSEMTTKLSATGVRYVDFVQEILDEL